MVEKSILIREIDALPPRYYSELIDFVSYLKQKKARNYLFLEKAAEMAADEYRCNKELTTFCDIDGEEFIE